MVLAGEYRTAINIHNPNRETVKLQKKIAVPGPGQVSKFAGSQLPLDEVQVVSCEQILRDFGLVFIHGAEGFLVIESADSLDVTAFYTAGDIGKPDSAVRSIAVERIHERKLR